MPDFRVTNGSTDALLATFFSVLLAGELLVLAPSSPLTLAVVVFTLLLLGEHAYNRLA